MGVADEQNPFADPGLPPHEHRVQDIDERAAKRSERAVAFLFTLSMLATVGFIASYVAIPVDKSIFVFPIGHISALNFALGLTLGIGAVRHRRRRGPLGPHPDVRRGGRRRAAPDRGARPRSRPRSCADFRQGAKESALGRRKLIRNTMFGALALVPLSGVMLLRDLGPLPEDKLRHTLWAKGKLLVNMNTNEPLRPEDVAVGSLTFAKPEGLEEHDEDFQNADRQGGPDDRPASSRRTSRTSASSSGRTRASWRTRRSAPTSAARSRLYEQQTHHVLCPCHQSTFDLSDGARVIFGPAGHALPQLRIGVNDEGYLEALGDFEEPVGPAFWERG